MPSSATSNPLASVVGVAPTGRAMRKPSHPFQIKHKPFLIAPFFIAPVLAGETLKNLLLQSRAVSKPVKSPIIGWWLEYYFFYVKLRDLDDRDTITDMLINPASSISSLNTAAVVEHYHTASNIDWVEKCLDRVVAEYFRDEGDAPSDITNISGALPVAQINSKSIWDSAINDASYTRPDVNVDLNANSTITASEVDQALRQYQWLRSNGLTDQSYEDYLRTFGIRPQREDLHIPELVRYVREWTYPANTVDPTSGTPSSALSWGIQERADKDRFFREPGFLFGVSIARPKVYLSAQLATATQLLNGALEWLPAVLRGDPITSMKKIVASDNTFAASTDAIWVDIRDLFLYGEQFVNFDLASTDCGLVALPTAGLQKKYPASADINGLFVGSTDATRIVHQDGVVSLSILGTQVDHTGTV